MYYGRISIAQPRPGEEKRVTEIIDELTNLYRKIDGCIAQYSMLHPLDGRVFKVGIWTDKVSADHAASRDEIMAIRAHLLEATVTHPEELTLEVTDASGLGVAPLGG